MEVERPVATGRHVGADAALRISDSICATAIVGCGIILLLFPSVLAKPRRTIVSKTDHHSLAVCKYVCTQVGGWSTPSASRPASQKRACQPAQRWHPCNGMQAGYTVATSHTLPSASLPKTRGINSHDRCRVAKTRQHTGEGTAQMPRRCGSTHLSSRINVHYLGKTHANHASQNTSHAQGANPT